MLGIVNFLKSIISGNKNKNQSSDVFISVLDKLGIKSKEVRGFLLNSYTKSFNKFSSVSEKLGSDFEYGIIWMVLSSYCDSLVSNKRSFSRNIVFLGLPGVGKSTAIISYLKKINCKKFAYCENNDGSSEIVIREAENNGMHVVNYDSSCKECTSIFEVDSLDELHSLLGRISKLKIILVVECNLVYEMFTCSGFYKSIGGINIDGIIFSKSEFVDKPGIILDVCYDLSSKIIGVNCGEISSKKLVLYDASYITKLISKFLMGEGNGDNAIADILKGNVDAICLDHYKKYMSLLLDMDDSKISYIKDMMSKFDGLGTLNIRGDQISHALDSLSKNSHFIKRDVLIIDSMRQSERNNPSSITSKRISKIAYGSGNSYRSVIDLINRFDKFKHFLKMQSFGGF